MSQSLPSVREDLVTGTKPSATFYRWFSRLEAALKAGTLSDDEAAAAIATIATALGSPDGTVANIPALSFLPKTTTVTGSATVDVDGSLAGGGVTLSVPDDAITNAKLANMATKTVKARKTAGTGDPEDCTLSELLDFVGSAANGDILYRSGGSWTRLPVGANGEVLTLASGLPAWVVGAGGGSGSDPTLEEYFCTNFARGTTNSTATGTSFNISACPVIYTGGAGGAFSVTPVSGRPAQLLLTSGASATGYARCFASAGLFYIPGGGLTRIGANITLPNLSVGAQRYEINVGFADVISGATTNRIDAVYSDSINGGNWRLRAINAGVTSTQDTSTVGPAAGVEQKVEIEINAAGTSATLYIDGVSQATIAISVTAALGFVTSLTKSIGATPRTCIVDYMDFRQTFTTPR